MGLLFTIARGTDPTLRAEGSKPSIQITPEQDQFIDKLANYYSKLMLSFDPLEISSSFDEYYETHSNEVDQFAKIVKEIRDDLLTSDLLSNLSEFEKNDIFSNKVSQYNIDKMKSDTKPNTFEVIKLWYYHNKTPKQDDVSKFCTAFEQNKEITEDSITKALSEFNNKHEFNSNRDKYFIELNNEERKKYLKDKKDEPDLSIHHVIPLNKLQAFFKNYYKIQEQKEEEWMTTHTYNWYKLMSQTERKLLLNALKHQHIDYHDYLKGLIDKDSNGDGPSTSDQKTLNRLLLNPAHQLQEDSGYSDFMDMMLSLPAGLSFRGPKIRSDDPHDKFEKNCAIILGQDYFNKVKALDEQINDFNKKFDEKNLLQYDEEAARIYNRILMIHLEKGSQIIFEFNPAHWIQENGKWRIKTIDEWNALQQAGEFLQKQIAQQQDLDRRTRVISISGGVLSGDFVHYKINRRRRNIMKNNSLELLKNKCNENNETPKLPRKARPAPKALPERHFCYSKPYYMLLPPVYVYCRLYYYK